MNHIQSNSFLYWLISTNRIFQKISGAFSCLKYGTQKLDFSVLIRILLRNPFSMSIYQNISILSIIF